MANIHQVINMGGYGVYVWTAYGITFCIFGYNILAAWREKMRVKKTLTHFMSRRHES